MFFKLAAAFEHVSLVSFSMLVHVVRGLVVASLPGVSFLSHLSFSSPSCLFVCWCGRCACVAAFSLCVCVVLYSCGDSYTPRVTAQRRAVVLSSVLLLALATDLSWLVGGFLLSYQRSGWLVDVGAAAVPR